MRYKNIVLITVLLSLFILLSNCTDPQLATQMKEMNIKMEALDKKMHTLNNNVGNLDSEFANLKKSFDTINSVFHIEIDDVKTSSEELTRELQGINDMKRKVSSLEKNIEDLNSRLDGFNRQLASLQNSASRVVATSPGPTTPVRSYYDVSETEQRSQTYVVKRGDTLIGIARRHNTNVQAIKNVNNLRSDTIQIGQRLIIPRH